ncbi:YcaO-like family protein [Sorangium sp. So ce131]|uniref:YcaO-like family protein n=1 Tax=Sorangium sp. So ce131 TaxID=3133282 RepID=UPI003F5F9395
MTNHILPGVTDPGPKAFRDGTHRSVAPEQTIARVAPHLREMGITRVANVTGLDVIGIPVVMACRPNARSLAVTQGKGLTLAAAKASALMESIEAYHAERLLRPLLLASAAEMRRAHRVVDVDQLARTQPSVDEHMPFLWIEGHDLLQDEPVWVPFEAVHIDSTLRGRVNAGVFCCSTNGLASGNHLLEALCHALTEVVERDSTTLFGLLSDERRRRARVDPGTVDDPACREVLGKFAEAGVAVGVWETTTDVGMPSYLCQIVERDDDRMRSLHASAGMGCHATRGVALLRALTEAAQTRVTVIAGARDDVLRHEYDRHRAPDAIRDARRTIEEERPERPFGAAAEHRGETFEDDARWMLRRLQRAGVERVVALDLTDDRFGIPVVKVVVPGLEGIHSFPGYVHGARARASMEQPS